MESGSVAARGTGVGSAPGDKGLKTGAIGFVSGVVIGVASTAPGYSLAASLGFVIALVGLQSPAVFIVAFIPMLFIATAYYYMNRADPDCGTTFSWVTRAMGPYLGWMGGWGIVCAGTIVMANLAQIAGLYTFLLFDWSSAAESTLAVTVLGVLFIAAMTWICVIGIELSARTQVGLLGAEVLTLALFAIVALVKVYGGDAGDDAIKPALSWFNPFEISSLSALVDGVLIAVFIYWGWDSTVTVNEETRDSTTSPGRAAVTSTVILVAIYLIVSTAAQAFNGPESLSDQDDALSVLAGDVFGSPLDKIVIIAVLTSAAASCQTTILPNARTALSMARAGAFPRRLGEVHPRFQTPHTATILFGVLAVLWYVALTIVSENHPLRLDRRAGADDRLLLRADRVRLHRLLPPRAVQVGQEPGVHRDRSPHRSGDAHLPVHQVVHRPVGPGELRVRRLVDRPRAAPGDRDRDAAARRRPDGDLVGRAARVLPAQA
ncbi:MAG: APC family permease [Solirubrobacteraceae bacterium]